MTLAKQISDLFIKGALEKGGVWGGPECMAAVSYTTHFIEFIIWSSLILLFFYLFGVSKYYAELKSHFISEINLIKKENNGRLVSKTARFLEIIVGCVHMAVCGHLFYCKYTISSLINLLQPCHVICFIQGIALLRNDHVTFLIALFILPTLIGTLLAMIFPETTGLDLPFEIESYWIQHYFIQVVPVYLLIKSNGLALKKFSLKSALIGTWMLIFAHYIILEVHLSLFSSLTIPSCFFRSPLIIFSSLDCRSGHYC